MAQTVKNLPANAGDSGLILGSVRSPGEGNSHPLQYSCLENSIDRETWRVIVHRVTESDRTEQLTLSLSVSKSVSHTLGKKKTFPTWIAFKLG